YLAVLGYGLRDEFGSPTFPQLVAPLNIRNADIHEAVDLTGVGYAQRCRRLVRRGPASDINQEPRIRDLNVRRRAFAITVAQNSTAEDLFVETSGPVDIGDGEKMCDGEPFRRRHFVALLFDLYRGLG